MIGADCSILFKLEDRIPRGHLLRRINPTVTQLLAELREKLRPFYSEIGRPSIDPELVLRMPIVRVLLRHPLGAGASPVLARGIRGPMFTLGV